MKKAGGLILAMILGLGPVGLAFAHMSPKASEGQSGSLMGPGMMGMMGGDQMGQMMPMMEMMQACTKMMQQMSAMMGPHGTPQQQPPQPEKK